MDRGPGDPTLQIRFPVDDHALSALHQRAFAHPNPPASAEVQPWSARLERHSLTWVGAFHGYDLIGFVHAAWDGGVHAFLLDAVVEPGYQRGGIGRLIVARLSREVRAAGCTWLHVDFEPHLEPFYRGCGFSPTTAGLRRLA